jgi:tetratricopeptide (TPR) repeat protein
MVSSFYSSLKWGVDAEELVCAVSRKVRDEVGGLRRGVVVFFPPGSSRFEVVKRLRDLIDVAYAYREETGVSNYRDVEQLADAVVEEFRRAGDRPVYRVAVVPRSTLEPILLAERLRKAKREDLQVKILYLPKYYAEAAGKLEEELRALAEVEHSRLEAVARGEYRGISPKPLRSWDKEKLRRLLEAKKTLEELSPGKLGLRDVLAEAFGKALKAAPGAAVVLALGDLLGHAFGGFAAEGLGRLAERLAEKTGLEFIEKLADSVLEGWGRDGARDKVAAGIAELLKKAEKAVEVLKDAEVADVLEAFLDQLALEWGMDAESFTVFVENLARLKRRRIATEDDLERLGKELAERLKEVYRELEGRLAPLGVVAGVYHVPEQLGVYFGYGEIYVGNVLARDRAVYVDHPAEETLAEKLSQRQLVVVHGPKGEGKSVLTKVALAKKIVGDRAVVVEVTKGADEAKLKQVIDEIRGAGREPILYFDPSQPGHYPQRPWEGARHRPRIDVEELMLLESVVSDKEVAGVVVLSDDLYALLRDRLGAHVAVEVRSGDIIFLQRLVESYSGCPAEVAAEVAKEVGKYGDNRALVAALAGDWLKRQGCRREAVAEALRRAQGRAVDFALDYIWYAVLGGDRKKANVYAPLIVLRGLEGPIPVKLAERILIDLGKSSDEVIGSEVVRWCAKWHHNTLEEATEKAALSPVNREKIEPRELHQALAGGFDELMRRGIIVKGEKIAIGLNRIIELMRIGLAVDMSQLSDEEKRRCAKRAAFILGHAFVAHPWLPRRGDLPEETEALLDEALDTCVVDDYMTADSTVAPLILTLVAFAYRAVGLLYLVGAPAEAAKVLREVASIFSPLASATSVISLETLKEFVDSWRRRGVSFHETFYALGLAALATGAEVDDEVADLLLYAALFAMQGVANPEVVLPVLAALRPLGDKALHRYIFALTAASDVAPLDQETAQYIYDALQRYKSHLLEAERRWPLVEAVRAYSNLLTKHLGYIMDRWEDAVADMCQLYGEVRRRSAAAASDGGLSAQRLFTTVAGAYVLATALYSDELAQVVQRYCGLGDLIEEAETVKGVLDGAATHLNELRKIMESDADFAEWVTALSPTGDAGGAVESLRAWFTASLALYKLVHFLDERGELDEKRLEEAAEELEKAAEMDRKLKEWINYFASRSFALSARVLAAGSWEELLKRAKGFCNLWKEAVKHLEPTAGYLETATVIFGDCLVYLAASGDRERAEELLKEWRRLLDYNREVSVVARLMLRLFGVGEGARHVEVMEMLEPPLVPEFWPALLMLAGRLQKDEALEECAKISNAQPLKSELCVDAVASAAGNQEAAERLRSVLRSAIESEASEARSLLDKADGRTLVEVLVPKYLRAQLAFMLLAAVEGRVDVVRLHGLWGSAAYKGAVRQSLLGNVYENCGDLNSEGCRMALLKLYYYHF